MSVTLRWTEEHADDATLVEALVEGPTDRAGVYLDLLANLPPFYDSMSLQRVESVRLMEGQVDLWIARIRYGVYRQKPELKAGESEFHFATGLKTIRRTISRASVVYGLEGLIDPPPPDARIIGWKPESRQALGVEDTEPTYTFGWRIAVPFATATESYRKQIGELTGKINGSEFFGYPVEEVRFEGLQARVRAAEEFIFDLQFSRQPTLTTVDIGGIVVPEIKGWDTIDVPETEFVAHEGAIVPRVKRVKIHKGPEAVSFAVFATLLGM